MSRAAREHVVRHFTWHEANRRLIAVYQQLLKKSPVGVAVKASP
jgi:hypothetical protein